MATTWGPVVTALLGAGLYAALRQVTGVRSSALAAVQGQ